MSRDYFLFFANFRKMAKKMSPDMRLKFYDAITDYVFDGIEPDDETMGIILTAIKPSLDKKDARGGNRDGAGAPENNQNAKKQSKQKDKINQTIKNNQKQSNNQNNQSFLEEEAEAEAKAEAKAEVEVEVYSADAPNKPAKLYAFEGKVIRLKQKDFDEWQKAYPHLNLYAELLQRDLWLTQQPEEDRKKWFISTAQFFIKQNERRRLQQSEEKVAAPVESFDKWLERSIRV